MISEHFSTDELNTTTSGVPNECPPMFAANAVRLASDILEPLRVLLGPMKVNSWYRSPEVNRLAGGALNSAHLEARAADVVPNGDVEDKFKMALTMLHELPIDQIILEKRNSAWIHIGIAKAGQEPRHQALVAKFVNGKAVYEAYHA